MPFAATASVGAFLRLSQALKCLGISKAALVCSSFYDDFVCVCPMTAMPYAASLMMWKWFLKGKCLFAFIENEGARSAWISGFASTKAARHMLHIGTTVEASLFVHPYFARAPTHSNLGDVSTWKM